MEREVPLVRHHHERYGGGGYPDGIAGEAIPLGARILGVADALDAITADRPYRQARPVHAALQTIVADAGRQFDPRVVDALLGWVSSVSRRLSKVGGVTVADLCEGRPQETEPAEEMATS
jgi:HD-GYP domain-containing protein (c-di-GMP phosphodiesterase class II)